MNELRVVCNPFVALDHDGVPAGLFPFEPDHANGARRWVGAIVDRSRSGPVKPPPGQKAPMTFVQTNAKGGRGTSMVQVDIHRHLFAFDIGPQRVPNTAHYRKGVLHGDIFAADLASSQDLGQARFIPPAQALAAARDKAIAEWKASYGSEPDYRLWPENLRPGSFNAPAEEPADPEASQPPDASADAGSAS